MYAARPLICTRLDTIFLYMLARIGGSQRATNKMGALQWCSMQDVDVSVSINEREETGQEKYSMCVYFFNCLCNIFFSPACDVCFAWSDLEVHDVTCTTDCVLFSLGSQLSPPESGHIPACRYL